MSVTNLALDVDPKDNPAGALYDLTVVGNTETDCKAVSDDNGGDDEQLYLIYGTVWDDTDEDDNIDEGEDDLSGWTVKAVNVETDEVITDETDANGRYELNVPAGTWKISEETESGWELLSDADGDGTYTVTVPAVPVNPEVTLLDWFIPTAMAASVDTYGPYDFGNNYVGGSSSHHHHHHSTPDGRVLGDSTAKAPEGEVLGASTSTMPVGAPNTGAGGTATPAFQMFTAILATRTTGRKAK